MKSTKKLLSLLLVIAMIFSLAIPVLAEGETTATLVSWSGGTSVTSNGETDVVKGVELTMNDNGEGLNAYSSLGVSTSTYGNLGVQPWYGTNSFSETNFGYMQFAISTTGYENLNLTMKSGNNGKAPASYLVSVSTDNGETWTAATDKLSAPSSKVNKEANALTSTVALPAVAADQETVLVRIQQAVAANNANNAGNLYVYALSVTGTVKAQEQPKPFDGKTVILHSNDVHGAIEGYANIAALKAEYEAQGATVILVDAGDYSQGTTYVSSTKGLDAVKMMNAAGYDFATLGNHEFDYGYEQLKSNMSEAQFKVLCANVLGADGKSIFDATAIKEVNGVKIGFFGLETPETQTKANPALIKGLQFLGGDKMYECAQAQVAALKNAGADIIVCLAHLGIDGESEPNRSVDLFAKVEGIDFIIDGHSHSVMEKGPSGEPIQSTGTQFKNIGVIVIDNAKKTIESNKLVEVTEESAKDETVAAAAKVIVDRIKAEYGEVFAKSEVELNGAKAPGNRNLETNLGDLITDSMMWQILKDADSLSVPAENVVAVTNGGGIRAWIHKGDITKNNVFTVLPFGNTMTVVYVKGADLLEALEASTYCTPGAVGGFPQIAGMKITVDTTAQYDANAETYPNSTYYGPKSINRVTIDEVNGKPFDPNATYAVATNNFTAAGGDTYYAFARSEGSIDTGYTLDTILMDYIKEELNGVIGEKYAGPDGRITIKYFTDIGNSGYREGIELAAAAGIINGYADGTFQPNAQVTRAQFITMLYRAAGSPKVEIPEGKTEIELGFTDADTISDAYKTAVAWGVQNGIIKGYEDNTFRPNQAISRAQMATMLYRYLVQKHGPAPDELKATYNFTDKDDIAAPYVEAVNVMANEGLLKGFADGHFGPDETATRGQAATILVRIFVDTTGIK
ncbi:MAG: S-layer homology domain-containing protein [Clostridia bacterium]|nr:S-layer homology domain-containing protein [Clostridia bacterium]